MAKTLRRFRTGEFRFIGGRGKLAAVGNARLLKALTQPARDNKSMVWASCRAKGNSDVVKPRFAIRPLGIESTINVRFVSTTISSKLRGTRNVKQVQITSSTKSLGSVVFVNKTAFSKRFPSCIDQQLKLKG